MKLETVRTDYYTCSGKASDAARQLAFAGIAVVWIFKTGDPATPHVPADLLLPLFFFAAGLGLDLLQYIFASLIWGYFGRHKEKWLRTNSAKVDEEFEAPYWFNWPALACFWIKLAFVVFGNALLLAYVAKTWKLIHAG